MVIVAIVGGRDFSNQSLFDTTIDGIANITEIRSGGALGADAMARVYAKARADKIKYDESPPDWKRYGLKAGPMRNRLIIKPAQLVVAFWDGKSSGTKNSIDIARRLKKRLTIVYY